MARKTSKSTLFLIYFWSTVAFCDKLLLVLDSERFFVGVCFSCRLEAPAYYYAFLGPILLVLIINTVLFFKCMWKLRSSISRAKIYKSRGRLRMTIKKAKGALGLSFLLGMTWLLAIPMMDDAKLPFQYIFALLNTLQGLAILVFQLVLNSDVRTKWYSSITSGLSTFSKRSSLSDDTSSGKGFFFVNMRATFPRSFGDRKDSQQSHGTSSLPRKIAEKEVSSSLKSASSYFSEEKKAKPTRKGSTNSTRKGSTNSTRKVSTNSTRRESTNSARKESKNSLSSSDGNWLLCIKSESQGQSLVEQSLPYSSISEEVDTLF